MKLFFAFILGALANYLITGLVYAYYQSTKTGDAVTFKTVITWAGVLKK